MSSLFFTLNIARRGLTAQQAAMNTASHNIANANTPGYSRQRAVMQTTTPWPVPSVNMPTGAGQIGTGVEIALIERVRDTFLDRQIRNELQSLGLWEQRRAALEQVEVVFMEPGETGLSTLLGQFWDSWQELSKYPESMPVRTTVIETAQALAEALQHTHDQLTTIRNDLNSLIELKVGEINTLARQIADLNKQIVTIKGAGMSPNDLLDRRDLLLDELSKIVAIEVEPVLLADGSDSGAIKVKLARQSTAQPLVDGSSYNQLFASLDQDAVIGIVSGNSLLDATTPVVSVKPDAAQYELVYDQDQDLLQLYQLEGNQRTQIASASLDVSNNGIVDLKDPQENIIATVKLQSQLPADDATVRIDVLGKNDLGGELEGLLIARDEFLDRYLGDLDAFARELAEVVNQQHRRGLGLNNEPGGEFFVKEDSSSQEITAGNIKVNDDLISNPAKLAAGLWRAEIKDDNNIKLADDAQLGPGIDPPWPGINPKPQYRVKVESSSDGTKLTLEKSTDNGTTWTGVGDPIRWQAEQWLTIGKPETGETLTFFSGQDPPNQPDYAVDFVQTVAPGDGTNALAIAQLRRAVVDFNRDNVGDATFDDYYKNFIARLGVATHEAQRMVENQNALVDQLNKRKENISGVSLDEEMVNLIQYQYAYQAAAQVINVVDEMLDTIINRMAP